MEPIYLDNASTSFPKPPQVAQAMFDYVTGCGCNIGRGGYEGAYQAEETVLRTRQQLCRLFHGPDSRCVAFTKNITESLNVLLKGLLRPGDHVLVSAMEHNAVMRPLTQLTRRGVTFDRIPCRPDGTLMTERLPGLLRENTRAVVMLHASNVCGTLLPAAEVGAFCRENGIPCYNFQYVKADYMENLDAYYYDLYHLNGEGADKFSAFFARFFNAYVGGEDVDGWFYADSAEYLASVDRVTNAWLMRRGDQFVADCNRGTQVTPLYRFCLSTDGVQTLLRDYSEDNTLPVSAVPAGSSVFVYAVPAGQPDAEPVFDMIWSSELGAYGT